MKKKISSDSYAEFFVVGVAQLVEHQVVALVAAGSIPVTHPTKDYKSSPSAAFFICKKLRVYWDT